MLHPQTDNIALGKGEADSSILSGSTRNLLTRQSLSNMNCRAANAPFDAIARNMTRTCTTARANRVQSILRPILHLPFLYCESCIFCVMSSQRHRAMIGESANDTPTPPTLRHPPHAS